MLKISIPTPCHEDWDAMTPNTQGRHCNSCVKTVVDFTNMSDEDVKYFFLNKSEEKVCGRFRTEQLQRITIELPENIFYLQLPFWKKFLAACLIVFSTTLFSCEIKLTGDVAATYTKTILKDSATMGKPMAPKLETDTAHKPIPKTCTVIQGDSIPELYNVVGISIAARGLLSPIVCAILMPLSSITVVGFAWGFVPWAHAGVIWILGWSMVVMALIVEKAFESGFGLRGLTLLEILLVFAILLVALSYIHLERIQGRLQGIVTFIVSILVAIASIVCIFAAFIQLMIMLALVMAAPFGTIIYVAVFGHFDRSGASHVLDAGMLLKLFFGGFLIAAQESYLKNKGLVFLILTSLLGTIIVSFLHNLVPILLVSITDAVAGIVMGIIALLWAIWFLLKSIPSVIKVLMVWRSS